MIYWPTKTPAEVMDYGMNWGPTLSELGDPTITGSAWAVLSGDVTLTGDSIDADNRGTQVRVNGGTDATDAVVQNTVTLSDGEVLTEKAYIKIRS